ncbi:MAG: hypothetical protein PHW63_06575 [Alphaproteobacteria bacterium]|nr:hypothetical protein [Alphaproteobacteria bacterium]
MEGRAPSLQGASHDFFLRLLAQQTAQSAGGVMRDPAGLGSKNVRRVSWAALDWTPHQVRGDEGWCSGTMRGVARRGDEGGAAERREVGAVG